MCQLDLGHFKQALGQARIITATAVKSKAKKSVLFGFPNKPKGKEMVWLAR
jgi:hypothetical protein